MNKYQYKVQGVDYDVEIEEVEGNVAKVVVNGVRFDVARPAAPVAPAPAASAAPVAAGAGSPIKSPLPGTVIELKVNVGDTVKQGDVVLVLEAMKMQNNIESEYDGTVTSITVKQGETVMEGAVLLTIG